MATDDESSAPSTTTQVPVADNEPRRYPARIRTRPDFYSPDSANHMRSTVPDPVSVRDVLHHPEKKFWLEAIDTELKSLETHNVWYKSKLPPGKQPIPTRFVFLKKYDADGKLLRYKARLVVKGYFQGHVLNTYAPVVNFTSVRTALALAVQNGYFIEQLDVRTAFLHGKIDDEIYVSSPDDLFPKEEANNFRLCKGLYGLKQAPRLWAEKWRLDTKRMGVHPLRVDECVFVRGTVWLILYVDDIIVISAKHDKLEQCKADLRRVFDVKCMRKLHYLLGISFYRDGSGGWLNQSQYRYLIVLV